MSNTTVERLAKRVDKPVATLIVSQDSETKRFIGEALLTAAVLYLLKRYCDGYLKGLGFDDMAKRHGEKTKEFIELVRSGNLQPEQISAADPEVEEALKLVRDHPTNNAAKALAESAVQEAVVEVGGIKAQGREIATAVSQVVFDVP
jgi:geranylgeranyl pyrophosphate synthase